MKYKNWRLEHEDGDRFTLHRTIEVTVRDKDRKLTEEKAEKEVTIGYSFTFIGALKRIASTLAAEEKPSDIGQYIQSHKNILSEFQEKMNMS